jgi:hypothetical protein
MFDKYQNNSNQGRIKMEELETKYYIITFADGHKAYMHTDSHLWEALKLHYDDEKISLIQRVTEREFYNEIFN